MEDMTIPTNVPALAMEEITPVAVLDVAIFALEEVFAGKGDIKEDTELMKDRKRKRASNKRKFKAINATRTANRTADKTLQSNVEGNQSIARYVILRLPEQVVIHLDFESEIVLTDTYKVKRCNVPSAPVR